MILGQEQLIVLGVLDFREHTFRLVNVVSGAKHTSIRISSMRIKRIVYFLYD